MQTAGIFKQHLDVETNSNPFVALKRGYLKCYKMIELTIVGFGKLITGSVSPDRLGGPIMIYQLAGRSWQEGRIAYLHMLVLISITLGVLNLLPVPVLDGGHIVFYTIEWIIGRPVSGKIRMAAQNVGVFLLLGLMLFAFFIDLGRVAWSELTVVQWVKGLF